MGEFGFGKFIIVRVLMGLVCVLGKVSVKKFSYYVDNID